MSVVWSCAPRVGSASSLQRAPEPSKQTCARTPDSIDASCQAGTIPRVPPVYLTPIFHSSMRGSFGFWHMLRCNSMFYGCCMKIIIHNNVIWFDVTTERVKNVIFNPTFKVSTLGLEITVSTCSTGTKNRIFRRDAMK